MDFRQLISILAPRKRFIAQCAVLAGVIVYLLGLLLIKYQAEGSVLIRPVGEKSLRLATEPRIGTVYAEHLDVLQTQGTSYLRLLRSRELLTEAARRANIDKNYSASGDGILKWLKQPVRFAMYGRLPASTESPLEKATQNLTERLETKLVLSSSVITVLVKGRNARQSADAANAVMEVFQEYTRRRTAAAAEETVSFLNAQLLELRSQLVAARTALLDLQEQHSLVGISDIKGEITRLSAKVQSLADRRDATVWLAPSLRQKIELYDAELKTRTSLVMSGYSTTRNPALLAFQQRDFEQRLLAFRQVIDFPATSLQSRVLGEQTAFTAKTLADQQEYVRMGDTFTLDPTWAFLAQEKGKAEVELAGLSTEDEQTVQRIAHYTKEIRRLEELRPRFSLEEGIARDLEKRELELLSSITAARTYGLRGIGEVDILNRATVPRYPEIRNTPLIVFVFVAMFAAAFLAAAYISWQSQLWGEQRATR